MSQMYGEIINVAKKLWIEVINLNKYTPNIQSYTFEMESWTMIFNLYENSIAFINITFQYVKHVKKPNIQLHKNLNRQITMNF